MNDVVTKRAGWRGKVVHELIEYWINFAYLAFFLVAFAWYRRLVLAEYQVVYSDYWLPLIEAAILAKVIMVGDLLRLGRRMEDRRLILTTLYRTVVFGLWVVVFIVLEAKVKELLHGNGPMGGIEEILNRGRYELLARCVVTLVAFIPFFAFKELERVLGEGKLLALFWRGQSRAPDAPEN